MKSINISRIISTGFGSGFSPIVSGTTGSAAAVAGWYLIEMCFNGTSITTRVGAIVAAFVIGTWASAKEIEALGGEKDPKRIVVDEWVGMWITLLITSFTNLPHVIAAFLLFRIFDILKPFPARTLESLPGAWGVMADDVMAGIYALLVMKFLVVPYLV